MRTLFSYKLYVPNKMTDRPGVDYLFVHLSMIDAISNVNGRHSNASGIPCKWWHPFGLAGMPRLLIILANHPSDVAHWGWGVHRPISSVCTTQYIDQIYAVSRCQLGL